MQVLSNIILPALLIVSVFIGVVLFLHLRETRDKVAELTTELRGIRPAHDGLLMLYTNTSQDRDEAYRMRKIVDKENKDLRQKLSQVITVEAERSVPHREAVKEHVHFKTVDELAKVIGEQVRPHVIITKLLYADETRYTARLSLCKGGEPPHGHNQGTTS